MSIQSESIVELFGKLCSIHLGETKRCHLVQPNVDRNEHHKRLKRKAFNTLFSFLKSPESKQSGVSAEGVTLEVDGVLQRVYQLRVQRRFQDADRLERLLEQFLADAREEDVFVLKLLVRLAGTEPSTPLLPLGHDAYSTPIVTEDMCKQTVLPAGPLYYGDCQQFSVPSSSTLLPYMHFPAYIFGKHTPSPNFDLSAQGRPLSIFSLPPGTGIAGSRLFNVEKEHQDIHEQLTRLSLFGGLVQARETSMAVRLDLPDLPDDPQANPPEITIPKALSMSELSEDEGFITTEGSLSAATTPAESFVEEDIWELALTTTPNQHYVWERIGCEPMVTESRYLTEAGPKALDELCHVRRHHEHLVDPGISHSPVRLIPPAQLIKDIMYLLIGIPSRTFPFSETEGKFTMESSVSTNGLSTEALHSFVMDFSTCGTHYYRLTQFSRALQLNSMYTKGLVFQAFTGAIRTVLQHYRAAVLSLPKNLTLLALRMHCCKALRQIRFLAELCQCAEGPPSEIPAPAFPLGVPLISYLYQETLDAVNTDNYLLMLSILRRTCQPFVLFVQDWVFHGTFRDVYGEFMIHINHKFLESRDELYWEKGYVLTTEAEATNVPTFLAHLAPSIFRCGKAINLLRMCCPEHFLCGVNDSEIPRLSVSYARSDLRDISLQCDMYVSRMQQVARQLTVTREEQQRRAAQAQLELQETARRIAAMEIARLQGILDERKRKQDVKKRKEFKRLKDQMTEDLQRRAGVVADTKEEDRQYMARLTRQEETLTEREIQLEKDARDKLIAFYAELGEEAAKRERRALWRIRRARLETARLQLLTTEEAKWKTELEEQKHAQDLLLKGDDTGSLPGWAQSREGSTQPVQVVGSQQWDRATQDTTQERDWSLPKWAEHSQPEESSVEQVHVSDVAVSDDPLSGGDVQSTVSSAALVCSDVQSTVSRTPPVSGGDMESVVSRTEPVIDDEQHTTCDTVSTSVDGENTVSTVASVTVSEQNAVSVTAPVYVEGQSTSLDGSGEAAQSSVLPSEAESTTTEELGLEVEELNLTQESEDRMPAWAKKVLNQSGEYSLETIVIPGDDEEEQKGGELAPQSASTGSGDTINSGPQADETVKKDSGCDAQLPSDQETDQPDASDLIDQVPYTPKMPRSKTSIRMVDGLSVNEETEEQTSKPHIQVSDTMHATTESTECEETRLHLKLVEGMSASTETEADETTRLNIMLSQDMHATKETEENVQRPHLKVVDERSVNLESEAELNLIPKLGGSEHFNISTETSSSEWKVKKASLFGHVSQLSTQDYIYQAPKLKRQHDRHASLESSFRDFAVKSGVRMHKHRSATVETDEQVDRPMIRSFKDRHANIESEYVDVDGIRRKRFLEQNVFGHSSDSTVQRLLYGDHFGAKPAQEMETIVEVPELVPRFELSALDLMSDDLDRFEDSFGRLNAHPMVDLLSSLPGVVHGTLGGMLEDVELKEEDVQTIALTPLSVLLQQALTAPLSAQISLVDKTVVNYFMVDLKIETHFEALHRYLFMADGDFAQNLTDILLEKLSNCHLPQEMLTPVFLNSALNRALQLSASVNQKHADSLSFALRYMPDLFKHNAHDTLDCLELRYKVKWPINVVLTESSQACYGQVFSFMLQLKRVAWTLTDCWYKLKRDAIVKKAKDSSQFRQLQLHRQEMQHFVRVMQGYMANQIIQVTWKEFQESLDQDVHSLDDLRRVHRDYLHKALFRCLLNKKAASIMKIIQDIFCLILKFCAQLACATWGQNPGTGEVTHPNFAAMVTSYKAFKEYFVFLFKVVNKLAVRGYQPHLHELLLRLNFNDYYSTK